MVAVVNTTAGIFNVMVIAQLWAFANDLYAPDKGERLFPIIGLAARWARGSALLRQQR